MYQKYLYESNKERIEIKIIIKYNEESTQRAQTSANTSNSVKNMHYIYNESIMKSMHEDGLITVHTNITLNKQKQQIMKLDSCTTKPSELKIKLITCKLFSKKKLFHIECVLSVITGLGCFDRNQIYCM